MNDERMQNKKAILARLKRIEGQVRGIQAMVEDDRECSEILQQLSAVRSAVHSTSVEVLETYAQSCMLTEGETSLDPQRQVLLNNLLTLIGKSKTI
jgi:DNA-binding FrmR family transcriptional regulator